ncbi:MAG: hypothetical protein V1885_00410 [Candidatus Brennerbacteria bacterium]
MKFFLIILTLVMGVAMSFGTTLVEGAEAPIVALSFPSGMRLAPGSEFVAWVTVSGETPVNAFDISLTYTSELELIGFDTAGSLVDLWQGGPRVRPDRTVELVGGMRTPFRGSSGRLVGIEFRAVKEGEVRFVFNQVRFYTADGEGTELAGTADARVADIAIVEGAPLVVLAMPLADTTAPVLDAVLTETEDRVVLLAFDVRDTDSGITATLVRTRERFSWSEWRPAMNPVLIPRSVWSAELIAINGAGLEATQTVYLWKTIIRWVGLIGALFFAARAVGIVYNRLKQPHSL